MNSQTGYLAEIIASLLEREVGVSAREVVTLVQQRIVVNKRTGTHDALVTTVGKILQQFFGRVRMTTWREESKLLPEHMPPSGSGQWQTSFTVQVLRPLAVLNNVIERDANAADTITTRDGWVYHYQRQVWLPNTLEQGNFRVCGKHRWELENRELVSDALEALIKDLWAKLKNFEAQGGQTLNDPREDVKAWADPAIEAFHRVIEHEQSEWMRSLFECLNENIDLTLYLIKQCTRVAAGLTYVELLIIHGPLRSGKDTFVNTLGGGTHDKGLMSLGSPGSPGWWAPAAGHYFTDPGKHTPSSESHRAVTHEYDMMRMVYIQEVPDKPLLIEKEKLEGRIHARAGHSIAGDSQTIKMQCLWLMVGNSAPRLSKPDDTAQVDRVNVVKMPIQHGKLDDEDTIWDVPPELRRAENPKIKADGEQGKFVMEMFTHTKYARACLLPGRKIEPRPLEVKAAEQMLALKTGGGPDRNGLIRQFCEQYLEQRKVYVEAWSWEVQRVLRVWLRSQGDDVPASTHLGGHMGEFTTSAQKNAPRPTPGSMRIWTGEATRKIVRNQQHCVKKRHPLTGVWVTYGLTAEGRKMLYDAQCAAADEMEVEKPPTPITDEEITKAIESDTEPIPERFK